MVLQVLLDSALRLLRNKYDCNSVDCNAGAPGGKLRNILKIAVVPSDKGDGRNEMSRQEGRMLVDNLLETTESALARLMSAKEKGK